MNLSWAVWAVVGMLLFSGCLSYSNSDVSMEKMQEKVPGNDGAGGMEKDSMEKDSAMEKEAGGMDKPDHMDANGMDQNGRMMEDTSNEQGMPKPTYALFDADAFEMAKRDGRIIHLEFAATWCPYCRAQKPVIMETYAGSELNNGVVGFEVPFRDERSNAETEAVVAAYNITSQHSRVILHGNTVVSRASGPWTKEQLLAALNQAG